LTDDADGRALAERLRAERDERRRLAELIHDGPVQLVAALAQMLDAAHCALEAGDVASGVPIVERALAVAREASADLREIVSGIEPNALRELGLAAAIRELADRLATRRGVTFQLDVAAGDELDQAVRRGPPTTVTISLGHSDGGIELRITDDGGQERREAVMAALAERAAELNATFASETTPAGTTVTLRLPPSAATL